VYIDVCVNMHGVKFGGAVFLAHAVLGWPRCSSLAISYDTIRYEILFSKADMSRLNLPHGNDN